MKSTFGIAVVMLAIASVSVAEQISGVVLNGTSHKPAAGDPVLLLHFGRGLQEVDKTTTDAKGRYSFTFAASGPHVVRVIHQGQIYDHEPHPGAQSVNLEVFDTAHHVKEISTSVVLVGLQQQSGALEVVELHMIENSSNPPAIADSSEGYNIHLPAGSELEWVRSMSPGQRPASISAVRAGGNAYRLPFPLRPGETRLQIAYRLKSGDDTTLALQFPVAIARLAIIVPKGLHVTAAKSLPLQRVAQRDGEVQLIAGVARGQQLVFHVTGNGPAANSTTGNPAVQQRPASIPSTGERHVDGRSESHAQTTGEVPARGSQRNVYILVTLLIGVSIAILLLRVAMPRLSKLRPSFTLSHRARGA